MQIENCKINPRSDSHKGGGLTAKRVASLGSLWAWIRLFVYC